MKKTTLICSIFLSSLSLFAQDTASVLFIGNSYTYVNDLPFLLSSLSTSLGDNVSYDSNTPGGATFANHAANPLTYSKINSSLWDYVVLQGQSQEPSFSDSQVNIDCIPYTMQISDSVYSNNFCTDLMMFMTWGRENGDPQWGPISTFEGMNTRLRNAYVRIADSVQGSVAPVGSAWRYVRDNYPTINLYAADGSHPSYEGSYLAACTFYASIFRKSPIGASYIGTLSPSVASNLQYAASITVLDSLEQWNLRPISEHTQAEFSYASNGLTVDFTNNSTKSEYSFWDFGDLNASTLENPSHTFGSAGIYSVSLVAKSSCDLDTIVYMIDLNIAEIIDTEKDKLKLVLLGQGLFKVIGLSAKDKIQVYDMSGRKVKFQRLDPTKFLLESSNLVGGNYLLRIETNEGVYSLKLPIFAQ